MSARYDPFLFVRTQSHGSGAASVLVQTCASSIGPLGPRTTPLSRTPLTIVTAMASTSAERASMRSADPLDSRPVAHCAISLPPGGPVTSNLYTSDRTSIENFPSPALRAHVGDASGFGGCAQTSASTTAAPRSSLTLPLIVECGSSCTTLVASASSTSAQVRPSARRVGACGVTRTEYVPGRSPSRAVPDALVSPQRSWAPATVNAQTFAPTTGAPAAIVTITASVRVAPEARGAADGGGELAWQPTTTAARRAGKSFTVLCSPRARGRLLSLGLRKGCKKVRNFGERSGDLLALLPVHEIAHRLADRLAFAQHEVCLLGDGHHDAPLCRGAVRRLRGRHAFGDLAPEALRDLPHRDTLREHLADHPVE